jgi:hypothetical protein
MRAKEFITESLSPQNAATVIQYFVSYASNELGLTTLPDINLVTDPKVAAQLASFGGYHDNTIQVSIVNRHVNDVLRTLAHELVHYRQDINGELQSTSGNDGSDQENEANAMAAVIMRKWNRENPSVMELSPIGGDI